MRKNLLLIAFITALASLAPGDSHAQVNAKDLRYNTDVSRRGTVAGTMLEIGVGAHAEALGGAFVSVADDPSALYWNPAGMVRMRSLSLQVSKTNWFVGTTFSNVDLVVPVPAISSALGVHLAMLNFGTQPVRTVNRPEGTGEEYSANDLVVGLYWAIGITDRVSVGLGAKYFQENIWHETANVMAADLSILFHTPVKGLVLGTALSNLGPEFSMSGRDLFRTMDVDGRTDTYFNNDDVPISLGTETYPLPLLFRFGMSYTRDISKSSHLLFAWNFNHPSDDDESLDLGAELKLYNAAFLRAGYHSLFNSTAVDGLTLGGGLRYNVRGFAHITLDYAWSDWTVLDSVHRFTFGISAY